MRLCRKAVAKDQERTFTNKSFQLSWVVYSY